MMAIGRDRTFRRYWVFRSTPGLFVEDDEQHIPDDFLCPIEQKVVANDASNVSNTGSDKENVLETSDKMDIDCPQLENKECIKSKDLSATSVNGSHAVQWSVFTAEKEIDQLIDGLNPRGIRESKLRQVISEQRDLICELVAQCNTSAFCSAGNQSSVNNTPCAQRSFEENLRDALLDIEDRIFTGNLGSIKVSIYYFIVM